MPIETRPESPSSCLLDQARDDLTRRFSIDPGSLRWEIGKRLDRKRSTLFHLTLFSVSPDPVATAYYKVPYVPPDRRNSGRLARARAAILKSEELGDRFAELAEDWAISINVTLALDPETLEVVTLGLEGRPMGNPLRLALTGAGRGEAVQTCFRVGRAIRIIEDLPTPDPEPERERIWQEAERKLETVTSMLSPPDLKRLEVRMGDLHAAAFAAPAAVTLAHGDLSPSNVIMMEGRTGLIDFMWTPQLRGFDLSRFVHRLRYITPSSRSWTSALVKAALDGYGDSAAQELPGWRFSEVQRLLGTVHGGFRRLQPGRRSVRRALDEIRSSL